MPIPASGINLLFAEWMVLVAALSCSGPVGAILAVVSMSCVFFGDQALLVRSQQPRSVATALQIAGWARRLETLAGVREVVAGLGEVALYLHPGEDLWLLRKRVEQMLAESPDPATKGAAGRQHSIAVRYQGPDLAAFATACDVSVGEVIARHTAQPLTVAVVGFRPDFAYCLGLDAGLQQARKAQPEMVQAGAVAVAEDMGAIYPSAGPGGWHVLGYCDPAICAQLQPGDTVHYRERQ